MDEQEAAARTGRQGAALDWLLASDQPSVRYYALTDLLGRRPDDPEVRLARSRIPRAGWARDLLASQGAQGFWERHEPRTVREYVHFLRFPQFGSSVWKGLVLSDLGLTSADPRIRRLSDRVFEYMLPLGSLVNIYTEEVCIVGNAARMLTRFGYGDDRRVRKLYDWMIEDQREDGGWNCAAGKPGTLDCWQALAAFAAIPKAQRSAAMDRAVANGTEFFLERNLFREGRQYEPWFRFHYPTHYFYDVLVGLDVLTDLRCGRDRRLEPALDILEKKRRRDGTWILDRIHPDEVPRTDRGADGKKLKPLAIETAGKPSLWITLTCLRVLRKVEDAS